MAEGVSIDGLGDLLQGLFARGKAPHPRSAALAAGRERGQRHGAADEPR